MRFLPLLALALGVFFGPAQAAQNHPARVLVLHSYHSGLPWTDSVHQGLTDLLGRAGRPLELMVEYLDTKRHPPARVRQAMLSLLKAKYAAHPPELVVVSDNNALDFMLSRPPDLLPSVPVVFCGINNFTPEMLKGHPLVTGVVEKVDMAGTLELILRTRPKTQVIAVVSDVVPSGRLHRKELAAIIPRFQGRVRFVDLAELTAGELTKRLAGLPRNSAVLLLSFFRDPSGASFTLPEAVALASSTGLPVFSFWRQYLEAGALGGVITRGWEQGRTAGELALRVLGGQDASTIPVVTQSPNRVVFNYTQMERFGLSVSDLPPGALVLNQPVSFYHRNLFLIWVVCGILLLQAVAIVALWVNRRQRVQHQESLRRARDKFAKAFQSSPIWVVISRLRDGMFLEVNETYCQATGWRPEELYGRTALELGVWTDPRQREEMVARLKRDGSVRNQEVMRRTKDGRQLVVLWSAEPIEVEGEPPEETYIVSVGLDITQSKVAHEALRRSEERYRDLFNSISDLIYSHDLQGRMLSVSPSVITLLGYEPAEIVGRKIAEMMPPRLRAAFMDDYLQEVTATGRHEATSVYLDKEGREHYIEYRSRLVQQEGREPVVSGVGRDVTERVLTERKLRRLEERLAQSQKLQAVGTLASGIAHDFNNLLQGISGYVQLILRDAGLSESQHARLVAVNQTVERAAEVVKRLLTFSRKAEFHPTQVDLNQVVHQAVEVLEHTLPKMVSIELRLAPDLWGITADPNQLEHVLINLGTNARDAMPQGGSLTITTENFKLNADSDQEERELPPGRYVRLLVRDTGHGMDRNTQANIFDPFFTTKKVGEGTGLGLFTVYGIVQAHQGRVTCRSRVGQGTEFEILLPLGLPPSEPKTMENAMESWESRGRETILLVDDEQPIREAGMGILEGFGYRVLTAETGEQALELHRQHGREIDLTILDLGMPGMGGLKCLKKLLEQDPAEKVIIASGYAEKDQTDQMLEAGAQAYLAKPYRLQTLLQEVRRVLDQ